MLLRLDFAAETISPALPGGRGLDGRGLRPAAVGGRLPPTPLRAGGRAPETRQPAVAVGRPVWQALTIAVEEPGEVQAIERTPIFARIPGYVAEVLVDMNDRVHKGQVLARLDVPEVEAEYHRQAARVGAGQSRDRAGPPRPARRPTPTWPRPRPASRKRKPAACGPGPTCSAGCRNTSGSRSSSSAG